MHIIKYMNRLGQEGEANITPSHSTPSPFFLSSFFQHHLHQIHKEMIGTLGSMSREDVSASSSAASIDSALSGSSWTPYIVDFLTHDGQEKGEFSSSFNDDDDDERHSSSVVSDAATIVSNGNHVRVRAGGPERTLKNLKKRKTKEESLVDEALEDTASSPHASPKVI